MSKAAAQNLNTNDGITEFEDGNVVEPKANRLALFTTDLYSITVILVSDAKVRTLLSVNYF